MVAISISPVLMKEFFSVRVPLVAGFEFNAGN
jgi:hypothetical protein